MDSLQLQKQFLNLLETLGVAVENISVSSGPRIVVAISSPDSNY